VPSGRSHYRLNARRVPDMAGHALGWLLG
jgi:hypothetical protein